MIIACNNHDNYNLNGVDHWSQWSWSLKQFVSWQKGEGGVCRQQLNWELAVFGRSINTLCPHHLSANIGNSIAGHLHDDGDDDGDDDNDDDQDQDQDDHDA